MEYKSIEEQKQAVRSKNELSDHLRRIIEQNDERFSFEQLASGGYDGNFRQRKEMGYTYYKKTLNEVFFLYSKFNCVALSFACGHLHFHITESAIRKT